MAAVTYNGWYIVYLNSCTLKRSKLCTVVAVLRVSPQFPLPPYAEMLEGLHSGAAFTIGK